MYLAPFAPTFKENAFECIHESPAHRNLQPIRKNRETMTDLKHRQVVVWDVPTRLFHWLLVAAVFVAFVTGFILPQWWLGAHRWAGYAIIVLFVFRFVWAAFGSEYSRLRSFAYSPSETLGHLRGILLLSPRHYIGHNPSGAAMIFALAFVLCGLAVTGLLTEAGEEKVGPLAGITTYAVGHAAKSFHAVLVWILAVMVVGHVVGVIVESILTRENLVTSMITGRKALPQGVPLSGLRRPRWRAALASWTIVIGVGALTLVLLGRLPPKGIPATATNAAYARECGACHLAYHPSLLPAASWQALLSKLDDHFGEDASLPPPALAEITGFLATHSAEAWDTEVGIRFRRASASEPGRITATPEWLRKHSPLPEEWFARKSVGSKSNCSACHRDAATGRFDDSQISVPKE
jgi:cytochrome b